MIYSNSFSQHGNKVRCIFYFTSMGTCRHGKNSSDVFIGSFARKLGFLAKLPIKTSSKPDFSFAI